MQLQGAVTLTILAFAAQLAVVSCKPTTRSYVHPGQVVIKDEDEGVCVPLLEPYCAWAAGPRPWSFFPNLHGQWTFEEALLQFNDFIPLLEDNCSGFLGTLLCYYYFPFCGNFSNPDHSWEQRPVGPCYEVCVEARAACERQLNKAGYPWPTFLDCESNPVFTSVSDPRSVCVPFAMPPYPSRAPDIRELSGSGESGTEVLCSKPSPPPGGNGVVRYSTFTVGSEAVYLCDEGHELVGENLVICQDSGTWSAEPPTCETAAVLCSKPSPPPGGNGVVRYSTFTVGSGAVYTCDEGYELVGENLVTCQDSGTWSAEPPTCEIIVCDPPPAPTLGYIVSEGTAVGAIVIYECNAGYELIGDSRTVCQRDGTWSGDVPCCQEICPCPSRCPIRTKCTANTFTRNDYTFALHAIIIEEVTPLPEQCLQQNRTFLVEVVKQYLPAREDSFQTTISTTDCNCDVCTDTLGRLQSGAEFLIAGHLSPAGQHYIDTQNSLVAEWTEKYGKNLEKWISRRG